MDDSDAPVARAYILGGNSNTLAFLSSTLAEHRQLSAWLVPLAWTPIGVVLGETWQRVHIPADNIIGWADTTFAPDDERAFVASPRELEVLGRVGWHSTTPERLTPDVIVNLEDLPEDLQDALEHDAEQLVQCAICRRTCVREHFVWNDRRMCAWDYHATVFGRRGPWRSEPYEERHFATIPQAQYVAPGLLEDLSVEAVAALENIDDVLSQRIINDVIAADPARAYLAVRVGKSYTVLRERAPEGEHR